jgi:hypothetical protein
MRKILSLLCDHWGEVLFVVREPHSRCEVVAVGDTYVCLKAGQYELDDAVGFPGCCLSIV